MTDAETMSRLEEFCAQSPDGALNLSMVGFEGVSAIPATPQAIADTVSFNSPSVQLGALSAGHGALDANSMFFSDTIDLSGLQSSEPEAGAEQRFTHRPSGPKNTGP